MFKVLLNAIVHCQRSHGNVKLLTVKVEGIYASRENGSAVKFLLRLKKIGAGTCVRDILGEGAVLRYTVDSGLRDYQRFC